MQKFIFILTISCIFACTQSKDQQSNISELYNSFPKLLDRNPALHYGEEWQNVQNDYGNLRKQIIEQKENGMQRIKLAALFCQEARVTGEHPHYYPLALEQYNIVIQNKNNKADITFLALAGKASVQLSLHDFPAAYETATEAVTLNAHNAMIYGALIDACVELGRYSEATEYADKMVTMRPDLRSYSRIAYLREIHGMITESENAMLLAIQAGSPGQEQTAWAMQTLAEFYMTYGKLKEAEEVFHAILDQRKDFPFAIAGLADIEIERGALDKAEQLLSTASAIIPEVGFYTSFAKIYKLRNESEKLNQTIEQIKTMMQEDTEKGHNMDLEFANLYLDIIEDPTTALQFANNEFQKRPENIDVNRMLAKIYHTLQQPSKANEHLAIASRTQSKHPDLDLKSISMR